MNVERLISHVTTYHKQSILTKFRQLLKSEASFLKDNGLTLMDNTAEEQSSSGNREQRVGKSAIVYWLGLVYYTLKKSLRMDVLWWYDTDTIDTSI